MTCKAKIAPKRCSYYDSKYGLKFYCDKEGKYSENGAYYCGLHQPSKVKARLKRNNDRILNMAEMRWNIYVKLGNMQKAEKEVLDIARAFGGEIDIEKLDKEKLLSLNEAVNKFTQLEKEYQDANRSNPRK